MLKYLSVFLAFLVVVCSSSVPNAIENKKRVEEIDVGSLIKRVIAGENVAGREFIVTGVALSKGKGDDGLLNLATQSTYNSESYDNFVSVFRTNVSTIVGSTVKVRVIVDEADSYGGNTVLINTIFKECISCGNDAKYASKDNKKISTKSKETAIFSSHVSERSFGNNWPLTISEGVISCEPIYEYKIVTFTANGKTYAVNGLARGNRAKKRGWLDVEKIWKPGQNISPLIEKGISLCGKD